MREAEILRLLRELDGVAGVSGREEAVGEKIAGLMGEAADETHVDALGNRFFIKRGQEPGFTAMLCAHMDEVGLLVSDIDEAGYVRMVPVGHLDMRLLMNQTYRIITAAGEVPGVTGPDIAPHECKGLSLPPATLGGVRLDVGAQTRAQAEALGIRPGDAVVNARPGCSLGAHIYSGRAVDNRAGCAAMVGAMRLLRGVPTAATVVACATVQEELGVKGVRAAGAAVRPALALSLDVCFGALDGLITPSHSRTYLGRGPAIQVYDWSPGSLLGNAVPRRLVEALRRTAVAEKIGYQMEITLDGGTDAAEVALCGEGVLAGGINIPNRYMHAAVGTVDTRDVLGAARLAAAFLAGLEGPL